jgi:hypothetical protein
MADVLMVREPKEFASFVPVVSVECGSLGGGVTFAASIRKNDREPVRHANACEPGQTGRTLAQLHGVGGKSPLPGLTVSDVSLHFKWTQ